MNLKLTQPQRLRIKYLYEESDYTMKEIAAAMHVSVKTIERIVNGSHLYIKTKKPPKKWLLN